MKGQTFRFVVIIVCLVILASGGWQAIRLSSQGYTTGYQGAKAQFYGLDWNYKELSGREILHLKGTVLHFDADELGRRYSGACNLEGEMTSVFVPEQPEFRSWIPTEWFMGSQYIQNPIHHYEWKLENEETNETTLYAMDEYVLKWYFSISADWDLNGEPTGYAEYRTQRYADTKVWFQFDLNHIWYFEGADRCYFAIGKLMLTDIALGGKLGNEREDIEEEAEECRVTPMSPQSILSIYYRAFGGEPQRAEKTAYDYHGKKLNPDLFTDTVYSYFTLGNFGTKYWKTGIWPFYDKHWKGDVVTCGFSMHVFVVGEWKVKDIQEIPEEYGRTSQQGESIGFWTHLLERLGSILDDPRFTLWMVLGLIAVILLVLAIFAPPVLYAILGSIGKAGSSKKKGGG